MKYILYVQRVVNGYFSTEYSIPLDEYFEEANAIQFAKQVKESLKDNYVVSISEIREKHIGYVND